MRLPDDPKDKIITIRLTSDDHSDIAECAHESKDSMPEWARRKLRSAVREDQERRKQLEVGKARRADEG